MRPKSYVYLNLHKSCWSVMERGIVQNHADEVYAEKVEFVVRPAGHAKAIEKKCKNVHAFVRGYTAPSRDGEFEFETPVEVSYNPYKGAHFYRKDTGEPVTCANFVHMTADRKLFCRGVE